MNGTVLADAFGHHVWATTKLIETAADSLAFLLSVLK